MIPVYNIKQYIVWFFFLLHKLSLLLYQNSLESLISYWILSDEWFIFIWLVYVYMDQVKYNIQLCNCQLHIDLWKTFMWWTLLKLLVVVRTSCRSELDKHFLGRIHFDLTRFWRFSVLKFFDPPFVSELHRLVNRAILSDVLLYLSQHICNRHWTINVRDWLIEL